LLITKLVFGIFVEIGFPLTAIFNGCEKAQERIVLHGIQIQLNSTAGNLISEISFAGFSNSRSFYISILLQELIDNGISGNSKFVLRHVVMNSDIPMASKRIIPQDDTCDARVVKYGIMVFTIEMSEQ
jgi:hypothetical protein